MRNKCPAIAAVFASSFLAACTPIGQKVTDFANRPTAPPPVAFAGAVANDGYLRITTRAEITTDASLVECKSFADRYVQRGRASTVIVSMDDAAFQSVASLGVDDTKSNCDPGTTAVVVGPQRKMLGASDYIKITIRAINSNTDNVDVRKIATDVAAVAAVAVSAGAAAPAVLAVAATAKEVSQVLPSDTRQALKNTSQQSHEYVLTLNDIRSAPTLESLIMTTDDKPRIIGKVTVKLDVIQSLFIDSFAVMPDGTLKLRKNTHGRDVKSTVLVLGPTDRIQLQAHVLQSLQSIDTDLGLIGKLPASDNSQGTLDRIESICNSLQNYADKQNFTNRDSDILRWAYLSSLPNFFKKANFWPADGKCLPSATIDTLSGMGFSTPPRQPEPS